MGTLELNFTVDVKDFREATYYSLFMQKRNFFRAAVVVNWMDSDRNVYGIKPDCSVTVNTGWTEKNGFYYYTSPVTANGTTTTAPVIVGDPGAAPSGAYSLSIEIVAEAIQAEGTLDSNDSVTAVLDAWDLTPGGN